VTKPVLGKSGLEISATGFGCMGLNFSYSHALRKGESIKVVRDAVERYPEHLMKTTGL
jgi:aryl-alcohol dehydrogenase-like predicted oxidoreductase